MLLSRIFSVFWWPASRAQHMLAWPGLSPSALGALPRPEAAAESSSAWPNPAQSRSSTGPVLVGEHGKFGCEVSFLVLIYSWFYSLLKDGRVCKQLGSCRYIFQQIKAFAEAPSHAHLHYSYACTKIYH